MYGPCFDPYLQNYKKRHLGDNWGKLNVNCVWMTVSIIVKFVKYENGMVVI